jgi:zinc transport system substrate-binding protein
MKKLFVTILSVLLMLFVSGCSTTTSQEQIKPPAEKIKVVATVYPVYDFAHIIGGEKVDLSLLVPPGAEPHDWEPKAKDIIALKSAKAVLYQGNGLEPYATKLLTPEQLGSTKAFQAGKNIELLPATEEEEDDSDNDHEKLANDPHVWLDPVNAQQEVKNILEALSTVDPANKEYYQANANRLLNDLQELNKDYKNTLASLTGKDIVTTHAAFAYLAKRYNLNQVPIMGLAPEAEPTPEKMVDVVKFVREHKVKVVFFETLVSPKLAETISRETGAKALVLNPIEGLTEEEMESGKNYISIMKENLLNLKIALEE